MGIKVLYFAELKDIIGKAKEDFSLYNSNLLELVNLLFKKYNSVKNLIWDDEANNFKNSISIAINDEIVNKKDILTKILSDGDKIAFLFPLSGG